MTYLVRVSLGVRIKIRVSISIGYRVSLSFVNLMISSYTKAISRLAVVTATFRFPALNFQFLLLSRLGRCVAR